jgi:hypothetical protein
MVISLLRIRAHAAFLRPARGALRVSHDVGNMCVFTPPLAAAARGFYARWGFVNLPFDPRRAMIVRRVNLEESGLGCEAIYAGQTRLLSMMLSS